MSSQKLLDTIADAPLGPDARRRLLELFEGAQQDPVHRYYDLSRLIQLISPSDPAALTLALKYLADNNLVRRIVRLESPTTHIGIHDYSSIQDIPDEIYDPTSDSYVKVHPDLLSVGYELVA